MCNIFKVFSKRELEAVSKTNTPLCQVQSYFTHVLSLHLLGLLHMLLLMDPVLLFYFLDQIMA